MANSPAGGQPQTPNLTFSLRLQATKEGAHYSPSKFQTKLNPPDFQKLNK